MENTHKMTVRLSPVTEYRLDRDYRLDGSRRKNEFIERAITRRGGAAEGKGKTGVEGAVGGRAPGFEQT